MANIRWKQRFENLKKANANLVETSNCIKANGINKDICYGAYTSL